MRNIRSEDLTVLSEGLRLMGGSCIPDAPRGIVVLLHGIPSNAPDDPGDSGYEGLARRFAERGWIGAWADLRGKRGSEGHFSIEGWVTDARALIGAAETLEDADGLPLALIGSSAGGAIAAEVVARGASVDALALLAAPAEWQGFASDPIEGARRVQEDAGMKIPPAAIVDPTGWAAEFDRVTTVESLPKIGVPILIVHGTADIVVPVSHASMLAAAAPEAELRIIEGALHQLRRDERAVQIVLDWLDRVLPRA